MSRYVLIFAVSLFIATPVAHAAEGQWYLAPGAQYMDFNSATGLEESWGFAVGLGFQLTEKVSLEASTFGMDADLEAGGGEVDLDHYKFDLFYDFDSSSPNWRPFIVGGAGNTKFGGENNTLLNIGAGIKYVINERWEWRTAVRNFSYLDRDLEDPDFGIDTAFIYYLGGESTPRRTASTRPTAAPAPASTPEEPETPAARDSDGDGVIDARDQCPDTPRNYAVDENGCPIPVEEVARVELMVNFDFDRSEVKPEYFDEIEEVADFMEQYPDVVIELEGHTDSVGTDAYNQGLSERRANAVRAVLIDRFDIQGSRISAEGFGESRPIASNDTSAGRAQNRRVMTVVIKTLQNYRPR